MDRRTPTELQTSLDNLQRQNAMATVRVVRESLVAYQTMVGYGTDPDQARQAIITRVASHLMK